MARDKASVSRRHIVQAASATLATASLATSTAKGNAMAEQDLINPVTRYPKPPFKKQSQPLARPRRQDGAAARSWREQLQGLGPSCWP
jgi:hypothetical protein